MPARREIRVIIHEASGDLVVIFNPDWIRVSEDEVVIAKNDWEPRFRVGKRQAMEIRRKLLDNHTRIVIKEEKEE